MRRDLVFGFALLLPACVDASPVPTGSSDAANQDATPTVDGSGSNDDAATSAESGDASEATPDAPGVSDAADSASEGAASDASDGSDDGACPASWFAQPTVDPPLAIPADAGVVVLEHAAASGTQNYACAQGTDGGFGWTLVAPDAELRDCHSVIGHHFASEAGASAPEWLLHDGSYAIGRRVAGMVPDGGASSIPWVLLQVVGRSDAGILSQATYVHRLNTNGGIAPTSVCGADGGTEQVSYTADYYFYGP
jgi:uncharacterized protein DUF3455